MTSALQIALVTILVLVSYNGAEAGAWGFFGSGNKQTNSELTIPEHQTSKPTNQYEANIHAKNIAITHPKPAKKAPFSFRRKMTELRSSTLLNSTIEMLGNPNSPIRQVGNIACSMGHAKTGMQILDAAHIVHQISTGNAEDPKGAAAQLAGKAFGIGFDLAVASVFPLAPAYVTNIMKDTALSLGESALRSYFDSGNYTDSNNTDVNHGHLSGSNHTDVIDVNHTDVNHTNGHHTDTHHTDGLHAVILPSNHQVQKEIRNNDGHHTNGHYTVGHHTDVNHTNGYHTDTHTDGLHTVTLSSNHQIQKKNNIYTGNHTNGHYTDGHHTLIMPSNHRIQRKK